MVMENMELSFKLERFSGAKVCEYGIKLLHRPDFALEIAIEARHIPLNAFRDPRERINKSLLLLPGRQFGVELCKTTFDNSNSSVDI